MHELALIRAVVLDVDGVLTTGQLTYGASGEELKSFNVKDGLGIRELQKAGVEIAVISGRDSQALRARLGDLDITQIALGVSDKAEALASFLASSRIEASHVIAVGDDLPDLAMLDRVAIAACPADAHPTVRSRCQWVTQALGGHGVVREISDAVAAAKRAEAPAFHVVIPSRFASTRLPGKPLRLLNGRPMIEHVWERARESGAQEIVVATDDQRIADCISKLGGTAVLTATDHESGTDRIAEVARNRGWENDEIIVNLQGDEPAMPPEHVAAVARDLAIRPWMSMATMATSITSSLQLRDPGTVKVVRDVTGKALYFSRAPIPWDREGWSDPDKISLPTEHPYLRHLGLYAYRAASLHRIAAAMPVEIEIRERLEQNRALAHGLDIHVAIVKKAPPDGVDTESDLERIERFMASSKPG